MILGVNIDHVATLRQARYPSTGSGPSASTGSGPGGAGMPDAQNVEPDLIVAASACERAGAGGITVHLRADRRHIQDQDVHRLRASINTKLNLEMGNTPEILDVALRVLPEDVCMVPENRREITTEGGLDAAGQSKALTPTIQRLQNASIRVSLFIEPDPAQIEAARQLGVEMVELHTGAFANAQGKQSRAELERLIVAAKHAHALGIQVNAGHGINYQNIRQILTIPHLAELNIGHSIVSRAVFTGLEAAVGEMVRRMKDEG